MSNGNDEFKMEAWQGFEPSPLDDVPVTGNIEVDDASEVEVVGYSLRGYRHALKSGIDGGYIVPIIFLSSEQAEAFVDGLKECQVESFEEICLDGIAMARKVGLVLPMVKPHVREPKPDHRLTKELGVISQTERG